MVREDVIAAINGLGKEPNSRGVGNRAWTPDESRKMKV
jgi:hypothetical protein